ncbi:MAG TPA: DMT family transporter [Bacteroidales bacterium]|jgi:drug/metabolite transporter (DMT)-like permease|nr:DMT family transporter [Bacteroidales bacterium]MDI9532521.1 DMT family transporter [Bacteroidota bacterium]MBK7731966.1 DMT family transporter [Bacteroidales bacterium]MBP7036108.1 DMT family transporter [Bacteroidales bacterium]HHU99842.1 DMT family transporter [Bacteroidales bacterium]
MKKSQQAYLYASLAVVLWGTIPTAFKIALSELNIVTMLGITTLISTAVLFAIMILTGKLRLLRQTTGRELLWSALLGLVNPVAYYLILLTAYSRLPGQVAQPINMIWPIILVFFSIPLLGQRIPARSFLALAISLAGVYIISSQGTPLSPGRSDTLGVILALISSVLWALYFVLNVRDRRDESVKLFTGFLFGSAYMIILMASVGSFNQPLSFRGVAASVYCGFFEMGITFWLWLKALQLSETTDKVSNLVYFAPFISLILLHFIIDEPVYYTTPAGLLLIIGSVIFQNRTKKT